MSHRTGLYPWDAAEGEGGEGGEGGLPSAAAALPELVMMAYVHMEELLRRLPGASGLVGAPPPAAQRPRALPEHQLEH
jgi:hypothetical protein